MWCVFLYNCFQYILFNTSIVISSICKKQKVIRFVGKSSLDPACIYVNQINKDFQSCRSTIKEFRSLTSLQIAINVCYMYFSVLDSQMIGRQTSEYDQKGSKKQKQAAYGTKRKGRTLYM